MYSKLIATITLGISLTSAITAAAQAQFRNSAKVPDQTPVVTSFFEDEEDGYAEPSDSTAYLPDSTIYAPDGRRWDEIPDYEAIGFALDTIVELPALPPYFFMPAVYDHFTYPDTVRFDDKMFSGKPEMRWLEERRVIERNMAQMLYSLYFDNPQIVRYNVNMLPQAPKFYQTEIDPVDHTIEIRETIATPVNQTTLVADEIKKRHWIKNFSASLQFSQAYVSPNWYQGGNDNLNILGQLYYNVKLNPEYHPKLLFDFTGQYKLGLNSAPDDSLRNYSISDDLLQLNTTLGIKAVKRWYYTFTGQFKTQLFNSYKSNTRDLRSAFLSPGELRAGVGMTYNYTNNKKTVTFEASINPLTYNLTICTNEGLNETIYGIREGHNSLSTYGSSADLKLFWQMTSNISLRSRFTTYSDYDVIQADWENTLLFEINRFLTTQIYAHMRYDSQGVRAEGTNWKKFQVKELLSIGFSYKFSSI